MRSSLLFATFFFSFCFANSAPTEDDYYKLLRIPIPEGIVLEAGGIEVMPDGRVAVGTRRGDIYMVHNAFADDPLSLIHI